MKTVKIKWVDNPGSSEPQIEPSGGEIGKDDIYPIISHILQQAGDRIDILQTGVSNIIDPEQMEALVGHLEFILPAGTVINSTDEKRLNEQYKIQLHLYPRIDKEDDYDTIKPYALIYMLKNVLPDIFIPKSDAESTTGEKDPLWEYLLAYQFEKLLIELNQLGFYSCYVNLDKNDEKVRGSIDFSRHIKINLGMKNCKVAYNYRKKTTDNPLNQLILRTYELLMTKMPKTMNEVKKDNPEFASIISDLKHLSPGYTGISDDAIIKQNLKPMTHPYYLRYDSMRRLCINIFRNTDSALGLETDDEYKVRGYLINMNQLFEDFVKKAILAKCFNPEDNMIVEDQYEIVLSNGKLEHTPYDARNGRKPGSIRPDFVVSSNKTKVTIVFDAKNKPTLYRDVVNNIGKEKQKIEDDVEKLIGDTLIVNIQKNHKNINFKDVGNSVFKLRKRIIRFVGLPGPMYSAIIAPIQGSNEDCITNLFSCTTGNIVENKEKKMVTDLIRIPFPSKGENNYRDYSDWEKAVEDEMKKCIMAIDGYYKGPQISSD